MIERWSRKTGFLDLVRDHSGVIAIEFALIVPIMLIIFFGSYEAASLVLAYMKLENAAETAADLVAQTTVNTAALQSSAFTGFTNAVEQVLSPLPTSGTQLKIAYASVTYSTGSPVIDWHYEFNGATALTIANISTSQNLANLGSETNGSTDSVIIVKLTYAYTSSFSHVLNSSYTLSEIAFNRPRYTNCVATYLNTGSVCP
jgi:Flp pilus assembly protein TadG